MTYNELMGAAKLRVRKVSDDRLDDDVKIHIDFVIADLKRIGVNEEKFLKNPEDPIIIEAVLAYVAAYYAMDKNHDKWLESYNMCIAKIKGGNYS